MQTPIDGEVYLDSGFLGGLEAMSEIRELLDEIYGASTEDPDEG